MFASAHIKVQHIEGGNKTTTELAVDYILALLLLVVLTSVD